MSNGSEQILPSSGWHYSVYHHQKSCWGTKHLFLTRILPSSGWLCDLSFEKRNKFGQCFKRQYIIKLSSRRVYWNEKNCGGVNGFRFLVWGYLYRMVNCFMFLVWGCLFRMVISFRFFEVILKWFWTDDKKITNSLWIILCCSITSW